MRTDCAAPPTSPPARYRPPIWRRASTGPGRLWCRHDALLRDLGLQGRPHDRHHRRSNRGHPLPPERARPDTRGTQPHALAGTRTTLRHLPCLPAVNHPALPGIPASGPARTAARWHRPKARPTIGPGCSPAISSFRAPRACSSDSELRPSRCISLYTEPRGSPTAAPAGPPPGALQAQHAGQLSLLPLPLPAGHLRLLGRLGLVTLTGGHLAGPGLGRPRTRSPASLRRSQACCSVPHSRFPHCPGSSHLPAASNQSITSTASPRILVASTFDSGVGWATARRAAGATRRATVPSTAPSACQTSQAPQTTRIGEARRWPSPVQASA